MRLIKNKCKQADASTRDALLAAAKTVFANHGFEGASVREIAKLADVNIAAISYHFRGKEGWRRRLAPSTKSVTGIYLMKGAVNLAMSITLGPSNVSERKICMTTIL